MPDRLFDHIEKLQGSEPWGAVLDAGTGSHSLEWIQGLASLSWTAVTGETWRKEALERELGSGKRASDRILCGNWTDPLFLHGETFETVVADYLLGAVDRHAPYLQDQLFDRLRPHVKHRLYVVGLEPYDEEDPGPAARIVREIARLRDACILLAGHRAHREYPMDWVLRRLDLSGFETQDAAFFQIHYGRRFIDQQLDLCLKKLPYIDDASLSRELSRAIQALRERAIQECTAGPGLLFGKDYVILARRR